MKLRIGKSNLITFEKFWGSQGETAYAKEKLHMHLISCRLRFKGLELVRFVLNASIQQEHITLI